MNRRSVFSLIPAGVLSMVFGDQFGDQFGGISSLVEVGKAHIEVQKSLKAYSAGNTEAWSKFDKAIRLQNSLVEKYIEGEQT